MENKNKTVQRFPKMRRRKRYTGETMTQRTRNRYRIYVDIMTGETWTSLIGQFVHPVGGKGMGYCVWIGGSLF